MRHVIIDDTKIVEVLLVDEAFLSNGIEIVTDLKLRPFTKTRLMISRHLYGGDGKQRPDEMKLLAEIILHHVKEAERELIPRIKLEVTAEDLQKMGEDFIHGLTDEDMAS